MSQDTTDDVRQALTCQTWDAICRQLRRVMRCPTAHLTSEHLAMINISVSQLDWHSESVIDLEPRFCNPFPSDRFETLFQRTKAQNYHEDEESCLAEWSSIYELEETEEGCRWRQAEASFYYLEALLGSQFEPKKIATKGDWVHCGRGRLYNCRDSVSASHQPSAFSFSHFYRALPWPQEKLPDDPQELARLKQKLRHQTVSNITTTLNDRLKRPGKKTKVHMAVVTFDNSEIREDRILRSEMIAALSVIRDQMAQRINRRQHAIFPVFVYSWSGFNCRVLQVHFDIISHTLIVRKTSYIEISNPNQEENIKLMLRWMLNEPTGATSWEEVCIPQEAQFTGASSTNGPPSPSKRSIGCV